jgi:hypothetical protein
MERVWSEDEPPFESIEFLRNQFLTIKRSTNETIFALIFIN